MIVDNFAVLIILLLGLSIGSFLNVVILRVHAESSLLGSSACPSCKKPIAWYDNIPLFSYLFLLGKCRNCKKPISWQYPAVEGSTALLTLVAFFFLQSRVEYDPTRLSFWLDYATVFCTVAIFVALFVYDLRYMLVPDIILFPGAGIVAVLSVLSSPSMLQVLHLIYGILVYSGFLGFIAVVTKGRGMGWGDVKLGILLGLFLGFPLSIYGLVLAFWLGAIVSIFFLVKRKKGMKDMLPFAPFLISGCLLVWFFQEPILKLFGSGGLFY
ncbi:MAG: prepilin peptidase [bacterium]